MFYSIASAAAICLCTLPVIWGGIASRISASQERYARQNRAAILAAAISWRRLYAEVDSARTPSSAAGLPGSAVNTLDNLDVVADWR